MWLACAVCSLQNCTPHHQATYIKRFCKFVFMLNTRKQIMICLCMAFLRVDDTCRSLKEQNDGKPNREEYNRLASEDPSLANDPSLH